MKHTLIALWCALTLFGATIGPARAASADAPAPTPAVTANQATQVLDILRDEKKRAELEQVLSVIAQTGAAELPAEEPPAETQSIALEKNGVVAQVLSRVGNWLDSAGSELHLVGRTMLNARSAKGWWSTNFGTPEARAEVFEASWAIALILALALAVEKLIRRILKRPRAAVVEHAARAYAAAEARSSAQTPASPLGINLAGNPESVAGAEPDRYWKLLRRVPLALANALLDLIPLLGFLATTTLLTALFGGRNAEFYPVMVTIIGAYVATRLTLAAFRLLISPAGPGLRLSRFTSESARYLDKRLRWVVIVAVFGIAVGDVAADMGAAPDTVNALSKLVALVVHLILIATVIQRRKAVSAWIRGDGASAMRNLVADVWALVAVALIAGIWVVWALGVANGFSQLLHYAWRTAVVVLAAIGVSIAVLGAFDRLFQGDPQAATQAGSSPPERHSYQALVQRLVITIVMIAAAIALLEVWGIDALNWFRAGSIGRGIASAATTIGIACLLAILAWESVNFAIKRRMERWTSGGDLARATRLRTLIPILRTTLLFIIALVVVLTALNQLGINIAPLLAGASILGVALGFGSQKLVQDFITGIFLLMENAMQVGDFVNLAGVSGNVEHLSIRTVRLRAGDGSLHVIPFSSVSTVTNTNRGIGNAAIRLSVRADSDVDAVIDAIKSVGAEMREDPKLGPQILADLELWGVDQVDGATMTFAGQIRAIDRGRWAVQRAFNQRIVARFRERGIQFANPQESFVTRRDEARHEEHVETPPTA